MLIRHIWGNHASDSEIIRLWSIFLFIRCVSARMLKLENSLKLFGLWWEADNLLEKVNLQAKEEWTLMLVCIIRQVAHYKNFVGEILLNMNTWHYGVIHRVAKNTILWYIFMLRKRFSKFGFIFFVFAILIFIRQIYFLIAKRAEKSKNLSVQSWSIKPSVHARVCLSARYFLSHLESNYFL